MTVYGSELRRCREGVWGRKGRGLRDRVKQPFADVTAAVVVVPIEGGRQGRVVAISNGPLLLSELRLRTDLGTHGQ